MAVFSVLLVTAPPPGMSGEGNGAFVKIDGREALLRSVELFLNRDNIKQVQIIFLPDDAEEAKRKHGGHFGFSGVKVAAAGPRWMDQWIAGAAKLDAEATHVIVHDAARPAVAYSDIDALMEEAEKHPVVSLAAPCRATLVEVDEGGGAMAFHSPANYMQLLTPQVFTKAKFLEITAAKQEPHASQYTLIKGSPLNIRVAGAGDASLVRSMIGMLPKPKAKPLSSPFEEAQW
jgi:2-C-methyl-D-erythritol 4-phosphate cytidylyltransferase